MSIRRSPALDGTEVKGHYRIVQQAEDGADRPHPAHATLIPAHGLGPGDRGQRLRHQVGKQFAGRPPLRLRHREPDRALGRLPLLAVFQREASGLEETRDGLLRRIDARALALDRDVGLHRRQATHQKGKATRRREGLYVLRVELEPGLLEPPQDLLFERARAVLLHPRRDLFGENLQQQVRHDSRRPCQPGLAAGLGQRADAPDVGGALDHADRAPCVEQVEEVTGLHALVVGRQR